MYGIFIFGLLKKKWKDSILNNNLYNQIISLNKTDSDAWDYLRRAIYSIYILNFGLAYCFIFIPEIDFSFDIFLIQRSVGEVEKSEKSEK